MCSKFLRSALLIAGLAVSLTQAHAQGLRMDNMRIAFITQDLQLTTDQAQTFWPVFNEYAAKRKAIHRELKAKQEKVLAETTPDAEINTSVDEIVTLRKREVDLTQEYLPRIRKVLTPKQLGRLITLEKRMTKQMLLRRHGNEGDGTND